MYFLSEFKNLCVIHSLENIFKYSVFLELLANKKRLFSGFPSEIKSIINEMASRKGKVKEEQAVVTLGPQVREGF